MNKYRPSNGTEGDMFEAAWCEQCVREADCDILPRTMAYDVDEPEYPAEWRHDENGDPECTAFQSMLDTEE